MSYNSSALANFIPNSFEGTVMPNLRSVSFYPRAYLSLKAQRTQLEEVLLQLETYKPSTATDIAAYARISHALTSLLHADYGTLYLITEELGREINEALNTQLSPMLDKLGYKILAACVSIERTFSFLSYNRQAEAVDEDDLTTVNEYNQNSNPSPVGSPVNQDDTVICRICDNKIPLSLIDEHSKTCALAYESNLTMKSTDDRMFKLVALIEQTILRKPWPGQPDEVLKLILPMLHASLLLRRAIDANGDELEQIQQNLGMITIPASTTETQGLLDKGYHLIVDKVEAATTFIEACGKLRKSNSILRFKEETIINDFEFIKRISSGAYARVFLARKRRTGDIYAIKAISRDNCKQKNEVQRLIVERDIMLSMRSKFIITFFYSIIGHNNLYLVMEYLPGGDLFSALQNIGAFDEKTAKFYTAEIVEALDFLRKHSIIHRDLKPDNILITHSGHLKLTDFGLSYFGRIDRSVQESLTSDSPVGTPDYMAPEVFLCRGHSFAADYWSLGCVLYEFLTGVAPFNGNSIENTLENVIRGQFNVDLLNNFSPEVADLVDKLLIADPEKRLGAKSIDEIKQHPWFKGIDWDHLQEIEPPFTPELESQDDTSYFEERYHFGNDESDIIEDIHCAKLGGGRKARSMTFESYTDSEDETSDLSSFPTTSIDSLSKMTEDEAQEKRSRTFSDVSVSLILPITEAESNSGLSKLFESKSFAGFEQPKAKKKKVKNPTLPRSNSPFPQLLPLNMNVKELNTDSK